MVSAVPALGGPLSSIMGDLQNIRKEKRFEIVNQILTMPDLTEEQLNQQRAELDDLMEKKAIMKQKYFPEHPIDAPDRAYRLPGSLTEVVDPSLVSATSGSRVSGEHTGLYPTPKSTVPGISNMFYTITD